MHLYFKQGDQIFLEVVPITDAFLKVHICVHCLKEVPGTWFIH